MIVVKQEDTDSLFSRLTFKKAVTYGLVVLGAIFIGCGWFILYLWIPTDTTGIWNSMDSWQKIGLVQGSIEIMVIGVILFVASIILFFHSYRSTRDPGIVREPRLQPPTALRVWALIQSVFAVLILESILHTWYYINFLGAPTGFLHQVPITTPLLFILVEVPAICLALLTGWKPLQEYTFGWIIIGTVRILISVLFFFFPWVVPLSPYASPLWAFPTIVQILEPVLGIITIIGILFLKSEFPTQILQRS